jgi:UDP-glucose 4-epimerase
MAKILVTGGAGYIGAHTIVDLLENGHQVISVDNFAKANNKLFEGIENLTGIKIKNYPIDLCDEVATQQIFIENKDIDGIIHFAAYKSVGESVNEPLMYYNNNLKSLLSVLGCCQKFGIKNFIFSSSCTVYGNPDVACVTETTPEKQATSPYGATKQIGEIIIKDLAAINKNISFVLLRYFNPVGAHPSNKIGEISIGKPMNLVPTITQTAIGKLPTLFVHGNNYDTRDGSCLRDYVHVCDVANAHTLAFEFLDANKNQTNCEVFNLGSGSGVTVLEAIHAFENNNNVALNYQMGPNRQGDVIAIYANNNLAKQQLNWQPKYTIDDMMTSAWQWELYMKSWT